MKNKKLMFLKVILVPILLLVWFPTLNSIQIESVSLVGQGASFPSPLIQQWAVDFYEFGGRNVRISYTSTGSGGGISGITNREVIFAASDAPLNNKELENIRDGPLLHIPFVLGAIVLIYNIPSFSFSLNLTADNIANIYQGNITRWDDPELAINNKGLPSKNINVVRRADSSGTTFAFTDYLKNASRDWVLGKSKKPNWESLESIVTIAGHTNAGVQGEVAANSYSIGYVGLDFALIAGLNFANVQNFNGEFIRASLKSVSNSASASIEAGLPAGNESWEQISLVNQKGEGIYPISTFSYLLVYQDVSKDGAKGAALIGFLKWLNSNEAQQSNELLSYSTIPEIIISLNNETINSMTYDTNYDPDEYNKKIKFVLNLDGFTFNDIIFISLLILTFKFLRKTKKYPLK